MSRTHVARMSFLCPNCKGQREELPLTHGAYLEQIGFEIEIVLPEPTIKRVLLRCRTCRQAFMWDSTSGGPAWHPVGSAVVAGG